MSREPQRSDVLAKVRAALGREAPLQRPPTPPEIDQPIARLVHSDIGLSELFARRAAANNMIVSAVRPEEVPGAIRDLLLARKKRRVGIAVSPLLERLDVPQTLDRAGIELKCWNQLTLDEAYDLEAGITDVTYAVAETGSLVIVPAPAQGRALSLVPPLHIAVVEPKNCVADLLDLMEILGSGEIPSNVTLISGPSKTADIEGALVVGVHGPGDVHVLVLQ